MGRACSMRERGALLGGKHIIGSSVDHPPMLL
jgi:hypothetical protein